MPTRSCRALGPLIAIAILHAAGLDAQQAEPVRGRVVGTAGEPVAGASVVARSVADTTRAAAAVTSAEGVFRLQLAPGRYRLGVRHLGYQALDREIEVGAGHPADLGTLELATAAVAVDEVTVETDRPTVVIAADRTIYHTRDMPAVQGGVATDALRTVPELDVDLEGNVTLQGSTPRIHVNGRPTPMQGEALQQFLQQLPAERIERIEVMPNPSARFEAEGSGGIVNIVLRGDAGLGLSGSLGTTAGTRGQRGGFGNLAYQEGRLTVFGNGNLNFQDRSSTSYDFRQNLVAVPNTFMLQEGRFDNRGRFGRGDVSAELRLFRSSYLWTAVSGGGFGSDARGATEFTLMDALEAPTDRYARATETDWGRSDAEATLGFKHVIEEGKHELAVEARHSRNGGGNDGRFHTQPFDLDGNPAGPLSELMLNDSEDAERRSWAKLDYERPVGELQFQVGYQANQQRTTSEQLRETFGGSGDGPPTGTVHTAFRYDQTFHQAYVTGSRRFGRLSVQAGLRAEHAATEFALPTTGESFDNQYSSLFPNANLAWDLGSGRRLGLNYSRRIQRPWVWFLNPVDWSFDPLTRRVGNPYLRPQYTHSMGADLTWNGPTATLRFAPYYRATDDDWGQITRADTSGVLTTTWENVASMRSWGAQASAMLRSTGRLSGNVGVGGHRQVRDASNLADDYSGRFFRYNANANVTVAVDRTLSLQSMLWFNSAQQTPQGRRSSMVMSSVGVRKQMRDNRLTLNLRVEDPFELARFDFVTRDRTHVQIARNQWSMRSATLNVSYSFGRRPRSVRRPGTDEPQAQQPDPMGIPQ